MQHGDVPDVYGERNSAFQHLVKLNNFSTQAFYHYVTIPVSGQMRKNVRKMCTSGFKLMFIMTRGKGAHCRSDLMNRSGIPPFLTYESHISTPAPKLVLIDLITALNSW